MKTETIVFAGGCFWCTEAVFKMLKGIVSALPGYAGGAAEDATYAKVSTGKTAHAEAAQIEYDPSQISFHDLLTVFFATHDPTTINRQGADIGPQYRSVIFYTTPEQKAESEKFIANLNSKSEGARIVTEVKPLDKFYEAENYHKDYYATHKGAPYCEIVINPKLEKVQKNFAELLAKSNN